MEYRRRPSLIGPLILITIGVLFLLANLGMLPLTFWEIAYRFWPLILILIGLEIIFGRRSMIGALIVVVLWLALVGGVLWLSFAGGGLVPAAATQTDQISQALGDIKSASVDLNAGISTMNVTALAADTTDLVQGTYRHGDSTRASKSYNVAGSEGHLALGEDGVNWAPFGGSSSRWDLALNSSIPIALSVDGGAGRANLDLAGLNVPSISIDAGVGSMSITTPKAGATLLRVNGGVGSVTVTIPNGVGARIRVSGGLGGVHISESRFQKFGDVYQSADYATAASKIDIEIDGGVGNTTVQ
ncbi:MAG: hypothetical protein KGJ80_12310 [Chloroflexota bacterium]|nr:hypothetical protein [Chloroflexota bacterium]